jgi:hypothetical protein
VRTTNRLEYRLERLATSNTDDKRISYGCINVPASFFDDFVRPIFAARRAVVYVLPEVKTAQEVFGFQSLTAASTATAPSGPGH